MQTPTGGEFYSPTKNISCEIDDTSTLKQAFCLTVSPPQSVTMDVDGTLEKCAGAQCLGNAGDDTPTLDYGSATGVGPFRCVSATTGVTCTVPNGTGFEISRSGITPVS